jgi:hypothetical protein
MSVIIPVRKIDPTPLPQFAIRSRREPSSRDVVNARFTESWNSDPPVLQSLYRPSAQLAYLINRKGDTFYDQNGIPSRQQRFQPRHLILMEPSLKAIPILISMLHDLILVTLCVNSNP